MEHEGFIRFEYFQREECGRLSGPAVAVKKADRNEFESERELDDLAHSASGILWGGGASAPYCSRA